MTEIVCEYCDDSFDKRGIGAHQAHCSEANEGVVQPAPSGFESEVRARDDEQCVRCESTEALVVHEVDANVGQKRANAVTLCEPCEVELSGLHPLTKRTKIGAQ